MSGGSRVAHDPGGAGVIARLRSAARLACIAAAVSVGGATAGFGDAPGGFAVTDHRLAPGDKLELDLYEDELPAFPLEVGGDGRIAAPFVGATLVSGMTIHEARAALERALGEGGYLVAPNVGLSVIAYREVFVTGDVKQPGAFPFRPMMSVEQAVALAGGAALAAGAAENTALTRATLQADLEAISLELAREATWAARLIARIAGRDRIAPDDFPGETADAVDPVFVDGLRRVEDDILATQVASYTAQRAAMTAELGEIEQELSLLEKRSANQGLAIEASRGEAERVRTLMERGLTTASEELRVARLLVNEEGLHLSILAQMSQARSRLGNRRLELARLDTEWREETLVELQERKLAIAQLMTERGSLAVRLGMLAGLELEASKPQAPPTIEMRIRRRTETGESELTSVDALELLAPGDVLIVTLGSGEPAETVLLDADG